MISDDIGESNGKIIINTTWNIALGRGLKAKYITRLRLVPLAHALVQYFT